MWSVSGLVGSVRRLETVSWAEGGDRFDSVRINNVDHGDDVSLTHGRGPRRLGSTVSEQERGETGANRTTTLPQAVALATRLAVSLRRPKSIPSCSSRAPPTNDPIIPVKM